MTVKERLAHVYWLGGSPCSGKSSVADRLAAQFGLQVYRCDDAYFDHLKHLDPARQPVFHRLSISTPDEVWLRPVQQQIDEEVALYREEFPMILDDLLAMPVDRPIIAEGAALLPQLVSPLGYPSHRKLWIVPTEMFQRHHYSQREWRHSILQETSDPERAWEGWMARDEGFGHHVGTSTTSLGERLIVVDGSRDIEDVLGEARSWFKL